MFRMWLALFLALFWSSAPAAEDEPLDPERAFQVSARVLDAGHLEVGFRVVNGYYLYKSKMRFSLDGGKLGQPELPAGKVKEDEFFGRMEIYPADVRIRIPFSGAKAGKTVALKAEYQGCAAQGYCYPPQETTLSLSIPASLPSGPPIADAEPGTAAPAAPRAGTETTGVQSAELIARLKGLATESLTSIGGVDILPPEQAFQLALAADAEGNLRASFDIVPGYFLYRDKIGLSVRSPAGAALGALALPKAEIKVDPEAGPVGIYHQSFTATGTLHGVPPAGGTVVIAATYQGCSDQGICFPPIERVLSVAVAAPVASATALPEAATSGGDASESGEIAALLAGGNFWLVVVGFFGAGLLLALTPCVFPMIPILSGIIVGQGHHVTKRKGFMLSLAYVLGMAVTYALAGVAAGLSGTLISNALQNPWSLGIGAGIFVALALSMFGFYELQLPSFLQSRFTEASNRLRGGHLAGVFMMGALSALIIGPCVAAPLAGALLYIGQTGDVVLGGVSLFSLAMGMGVPLLLVGLSAGALLPRAGGWMEAVKKFFGVLLLGVAIWLLSSLISEVVQMLVWAALLIISGVYLRAVDPLLAHTGGWPRFWKGVGIICMVAGIALLLGAFAGGRNILQPLAVFKGGVAGPSQAEDGLRFQRVRNIAELEAAVKGAAGRPVMLDFYADWCTSCKEMEHFTFADPAVQRRLQGVLLLQADVTANSDDDAALLKRFSLFGPPGIIFFAADGREIAFRVIGYEPPEKFLRSLDRALP